MAPSNTACRLSRSFSLSVSLSLFALLCSGSELGAVLPARALGAAASLILRDGLNCLSLSLPGVRVATASRPLPSCAHAHPRSLAGLLPPLSVFSTERLGCTRGKLPPTGVQAVFPRGASFSPQGSKQVLVSFTVPTKHTLHTASLTEGPAEEVLVTTAAVTPNPCSVE